MVGFWKCIARFCANLAGNLLFSMAGILVFGGVCWLYWGIGGESAEPSKGTSTEKTGTASLTDVSVFQVDGDSMLPYLSGGAYCETCPCCGYRGLFSCKGAGVCPNCRWVTLEKERWTDEFGKVVDRVQIFDEVAVVAEEPASQNEALSSEAPAESARNAETPAVETPTTETPTIETPTTETPTTETPTTETPTTETPTIETPTIETPTTETPTTETPTTETPTVETPVAGKTEGGTSTAEATAATSPTSGTEWDWQLDDCVCFVDAQRGVCIKRIAACPGDTLEIRDGRRFINGQRPLRSLDTLRQMRILVHDDRFRPAGVSRWQKTESETELQWQYQHAEGRLKVVGNVPQCELVPALVTNGLAQNGTQMRSDQTFEMTELMLECTLKYTRGEGAVCVELPTAQFSVPVERLREKPDARWCFSTLDGTPRAWRDSELVELPVTAIQTEFPQIALPKTLNVLVTDRVLYRDEYILQPKSQTDVLKVDCGEGWFLLGDNTLVSRDSRYWGPVKLTRQNARKVCKKPRSLE